jgi:vancomycin resistance protein VanJ
VAAPDAPAGPASAAGHSRRDRLILGAFAVLPVTVVALSLAEAIARLRVGPLALFAAFEPYAFLALVLLVPAAFLRDARLLRLGLAAALIVGVARFGSDWVSLPFRPAAEHPVVVVTWNLLYNGATPEADAAVIAGLDANLVSLQELTIAKAAGIDADPAVRARYPYRVLSPRSTLGGVGLLSDRPLSDVVVFDSPPGIQAVAATDGGPVTIVAAHPTHGNVDTSGVLALIGSYDTTIRDGQLADLHARIASAIGRGERVILAGDMNTAPTEPAFADLMAGLLDVHREVGEGTGWTWRPSVLEDWGVGFVAIDHIIVSPDLVPLDTTIVCLPLSDHCRLWARIGVPPRAGADRGALGSP